MVLSAAVIFITAFATPCAGETSKTAAQLPDGLTADCSTLPNDIAEWCGRFRGPWVSTSNYFGTLDHALGLFKFSLNGDGTYSVDGIYAWCRNNLYGATKPDHTVFTGTLNNGILKAILGNGLGSLTP